MYIIVCVDDKLGMAFGGRRQSMDAVLREHIVQHVGEHPLWMRNYSCKQFEENKVPALCVDEDYLVKAKEDDYCFVELDDISGYLDRIQGIILCRWNRRYPANLFLKIPGNIENWSIKVLEEFKGFSHDKITVESWINLKYQPYPNH